VSDPLVPVGDGHTEVPADERAQLIPTWVATRGELFAAEEASIAVGTLGLAPSAAALLDDLYLRRLHTRMFDKVWKWAGRYRRHETNLGIDPVEIPAAVRALVADASAWVEHGTYDVDELCIRFHHRLVAIHPFVNGNGRHGRISTDLLAKSLGGPAFTWGQNLTVDTAELRHRYRTALQRADRDNDDVTDLIAFARS
jgi:Fic-DOC domain mobile mystery protein B